MPFRRKILSYADARTKARRRLPRLIFDYIDGAAGREEAAHRNEAAFDHVLLQPRALRNVAVRDLSTQLMGETYDVPFGIAPMGMCNISDPKADQHLAGAAKAFNMPHCLSTVGSSNIEELRGWAGENAWFQLYMGGKEAEALALVDRAAAAGYRTLILTVDVPQVARRLRDVHNGFQMPFTIGPKQFFDFATHPFWSIPMALNGAPQPRNFIDENGKNTLDRGASRAGADWNFLDRLRAHWTGNLLVKGVMSTEDAKRIVAAGADGVIVSNHGGRQLGGSPAALTMLPRIRAALGDGPVVCFDSGLRGGEDIVKALALGADFVFLGRPLLMAMGAAGAAGLTEYLESIREEVSLTMAQIGVTAIDQINSDVLAEAMADDG